MSNSTKAPALAKLDYRRTFTVDVGIPGVEVIVSPCPEGDDFEVRAMFKAYAVERLPASLVNPGEIAASVGKVVRDLLEFVREEARK